MTMDTSILLNIPSSTICCRKLPPAGIPDAQAVTLLAAAAASPGAKAGPERISPTGGFNITNTGWWFEPLWKIWKSIGMIIPNIWENKKCSKPPTRIGFLHDGFWFTYYVLCQQAWGFSADGRSRSIEWWIVFCATWSSAVDIQSINRSSKQNAGYLRLAAMQPAVGGPGFSQFSLTQSGWMTMNHSPKNSWNAGAGTIPHVSSVSSIIPVTS